MRKNLRLTSIMAIVTVMALLIGTLAFFTDRVSANASATTISNAVDIVPVDPDTDKEIPDDPTKADDGLTGFWATNNTARVNYNPGDRMDLSYDLKNNGSLDVKIRETFVITSDVAMTKGAPEFALCTSTKAGSYGGFEPSSVLGEAVGTDNKTYKYTVNTETLGDGETSSKTYYVVFNEDAKNTFQGATCTVSYLVEALQSDGTWDTVTTANFALGNQTVSAVPAA